MSSEFAIRATNLGKTYRLYAHPMARLRQLILPGGKKHYKEFHALQDVNFEIKKGETVGIIGRNGSGKSTLLQLICGILKPTTGSVEVNGRVSALLELGAGFHPEFTGRENVYMQGAIMGLTRAEMDARFDDIAAFADIGDFIEQPVKTYSSGMFVRLAFAVMVHVDAGILVIDEALAVGDIQFTQKCITHLNDFRKRGTLLVVSHDIATVTSLCDRVIWLDKGAARKAGGTKDVCDDYLISMFGILKSKQVTSTSTPAEESVSDQRRELINNSTLRNDLEVFRFDFSGVPDNQGKAKIVEATLLDEENHPYSWVVGGEKVTLRIRARTTSPVEAPIIGFTVQDKNGRSVFGDNTYLSYAATPVCVPSGVTLEARFTFGMPRLPVGDYAITVAIAEGTQSQHTTHDWRPDALVIRARASSTTGDLGLPMIAISLAMVATMEAPH